MNKFAANVKAKKRVNTKWILDPFPNSKDFKIPFTGVFTGISVEITDIQDIQNIYESGFYGKGSNSRSAPLLVKTREHTKTNKSICNLEETLVLDLEESFFLSQYLNVLRITNTDGDVMSWKQLLHAFHTIKHKFIECFATYLYLKSKNWIVKSGIKFGGDFLIYKKGLRYYHASFIVIVNTPDKCSHLLPKEIKGLQRIAETSDKDVLLLEIINHTEISNINCADDIALCQISETIIRRFNYTGFVQSQNLTK